IFTLIGLYSFTDCEHPLPSRVFFWFRDYLRAGMPPLSCHSTPQAAWVVLVSAKYLGEGTSLGEQRTAFRAPFFHFRETVSANHNRLSRRRGVSSERRLIQFPAGAIAA